MAPLGSSLGSVRAWAQLCFITDFEQLPRPNGMSQQLHAVPGYCESGFLKGLVIGTAMSKTQKPVKLLAWLHGDKMQIGYVGKTREGKAAVRLKKAQDADTRLDLPFRFVLDADLSAALPRLEALVRYYFLVKGSVGSSYVQDAYEDFETHFPGACQAVATGYRALASLYTNNLQKLEAGRVPDEKSRLNSTFVSRDIDHGGNMAVQPPHREVVIFNSPSPRPPPSELTENPMRPRDFFIFPSPSPSPPPRAFKRAHTEPFKSKNCDKAEGLSSFFSASKIVIESTDINTEIISELCSAHNDEVRRLRKENYDLHIRLMVAEKCPLTNEK